MSEFALTIHERSRTVRHGRPGWRRALTWSASATVTAVLCVGAVSCGSQGEQAPAAGPTPAPTTSMTPGPIPAPSEVPFVPPERRDAAFANALAEKNLQVGDPDMRAQVARSVCESLDAGASLLDLAPALQDALGGPTPPNIGYIIGAATAIYCPQNLEKLRPR